MKYNRPNFLIVGAAKCGTTALAKYLSQHPDIYIPRLKEPRYFAKDAIKKISKNDPLCEQIHKTSVLNVEEYYYLFKDSGRYKCRGEASVHYLYHYESVIPKIKKELGDINIIIILRNPIIRAISNYYYIKGEKLSFNKALNIEKDRMKAGYNSFWFYKELGFYYHQIKAFINNFSKVKVLLYEVFKENPDKICEELFDFIGVNSDFIVNTNKQYNVTLTPKSSLHKSLLQFEIKAITLKKILMLFAGEKLREYKKTWFAPPRYYIEKELYNSLVDEYQGDILKIEAMLNVDLSYWKEKQ